MSAGLSIRIAALAAVLFAAVLGCRPDIDPGAGAPAEIPDDDPLSVQVELDPASLDALHRDILVRSCAAQPGLCHHGQFEPDLSTPALAYENLVYRPGIEGEGRHRVSPGEPDRSLLVDKLRDRGVLSRMPLGARPLPEEEIAAIERWIADGALRHPGAEPAPRLNNPPAAPQMGVFDAEGRRLDAGAPVAVAAGTPLTLRHSARDFETRSVDISYSVFFLELAGGKEIVLGDVAARETAGRSAYEPGAQGEEGDRLDFRFDWTVPATVLVVGPDGSVTEESTAGKSITVIAAYLDSAGPGESMLTFSFEPDWILVSP